jgi:hypothetical protein
MSNDREFDSLAGTILDLSQRNADKRPGDPEWTDEAWQARVKKVLQLIYRAGARAQLDHSVRRQVDPVDRVRWLADHGFMAGDVAEVVREVEDLRERTAALQGSYGVTESAIRSMIGEGFHTAFRKAVDSTDAAIAWKAIRDMDNEEYAAVVGFTADPIIKALRYAEAQAAETGPNPEGV